MVLSGLGMTHLPGHSFLRDFLVGAARATRNILEKPELFVLQTSLEYFYVSGEINAYTGVPGYMAFTYSELHKNIL